MATTPAADAEERIAALEKKYRELDALAKGLVNELLDLKSIIRKMAGQSAERAGPEAVKAAGPDPASAEELPGPEHAPAPSSESERVVIVPKGAPETKAADEPVMVRIMQPDGTFKMEPRRGNASTASSSSFDSGRKSTLFRGRKKQ